MVVGNTFLCSPLFWGNDPIWSHLTIVVFRWIESIHKNTDSTHFPAGLFCLLVCLTTGSILISDIRIAARLEHVRQKFRQEIPEDADDATMNAYCNLSWPTSWFLSRSTGWQNDRCVVWMGGAEGYSNQILSMLRAYELVRPRKLLLVPMATEHATEPECLNKAMFFQRSFPREVEGVMYMLTL